MKNFPLLIALDNAIMVSDNEKSSELKTMKINEMEKDFKRRKGVG